LFRIEIHEKGTVRFSQSLSSKKTKNNVRAVISQTV